MRSFPVASDRTHAVAADDPTSSSSEGGASSETFSLLLLLCIENWTRFLRMLLAEEAVEDEVEAADGEARGWSSSLQKNFHKTPNK